MTFYVDTDYDFKDFVEKGGKLSYFVIINYDENELIKDSEGNFGKLIDENATTDRTKPKFKSLDKLR